MKLIFAGTPAFAATALEALVEAGHEVALVLTQPDRPAGRGLKPQPSAVKTAALAHGLSVAQPATLKSADIQDTLAASGARAMIVAAYGLILPPAVLALPPLGCINIHASLLPRWRGAAPIQRALLAGDAETGITIMRMDAGLDTGPILLKEALPITQDDTAATLHDTLAVLGARLLLRVLEAMPAGQPQDDSAATYAAKLSKEEAVIDWQRPADAIARQVRAFNPVPGAATTLDGAGIKIWQARAVAGAAGAALGAVLEMNADGITVACGHGALLITELQKAGARRVAAREFVAGARLAPHSRFGAPH